jgi:hypothetical protein
MAVRDLLNLRDAADHAATPPPNFTAKSKLADLPKGKRTDTLCS